MLKIFKYLKTSIISILIIIGLLIVQANLDLKLPDYTSKIINIGIGQNGIENAIPEVISESTFNSLSLILSKEDKEYLLDSYKLIGKENEDYLEKYPILKDENIYILDTSKTEKIEEILNETFSILYVGEMFSNAENSSFKIPEGMTFIDVLSTMDETSRKATIEKIEEGIKEMPETILNSSAIEYVKGEYQKVGIDLSKMQTNYIIVSGAKMLGIALLIMVISICITFFGSRLAAKLAYTLRAKVFEKVVRFSKTEIKKFGT